MSLFAPIVVMSFKYSCAYAQNVTLRMASDCDNERLAENAVCIVAKKVLDIAAAASNGGFQTVYCGIWEPELDFNLVPKLFEDVGAPFYAELIREANKVVPPALLANSLKRIYWLEENDDKLQEIADVFDPAAIHSLCFRQAMVLYALKHPKCFPTAIQFIREHLETENW